MNNINLDHVKPAVRIGMFGETSGVWNTNVLLERGKHYMLRSGSGRGKTSAVSFLYGVRKDYTGSILFDDQNISEFGLTRWSTIRSAELSVVFQDLRLFRQLSALDNVLLKNHVGTKMPQDRIMIMFDDLGLMPLIGKPAETLSFGEQQRVAVIRALVQPFSFLLMDEPFSHLDVINIQKGVKLILEECARRGASLVMTSLGDDYGIPFDNIMEV
jgi:ABC-type lipoprotein export system ATPase subunit